MSCHAAHMLTKPLPPYFFLLKQIILPIFLASTGYGVSGDSLFESQAKQASDNNLIFIGEKNGQKKHKTQMLPIVPP